MLRKISFWMSGMNYKKSLIMELLNKTFIFSSKNLITISKVLIRFDIVTKENKKLMVKMNIGKR